MNNSFQISSDNWHLFLLGLSESYQVYAPVKTYEYVDYKIYNDQIDTIAYHVARPVTPLKVYFLPPKENVVIEKNNHNKKVIVGVPACDLKALEILDEIYLDQDYVDQSYRQNRENTILIATDCHMISDNCHCTSYDIDPFPVRSDDATLVSVNGDIIVMIHSEKGYELFNTIASTYPVQEPGIETMRYIQEKRDQVKMMLNEKNRLLPDYRTTGDLMRKSDDDIWIKYAKTCVSCGVCATSCPTCTCFLLIDRPDFEKIRQVDTCQYPGFEKIAAGEDPLKKKFVRFRNRYLCKYVWKPETFNSMACTGCGRCIDGCIGNISKNKIFIEMNKSG
jgi:sulfhydrogenase subunit beta (sulfur reductase)